MTVSPDVATGGLTELAVRTRVDAGQVNTIPPAPGRSLAQILRANVLTRFNAILGALFVVVLVVGPLQDALFGVVLVVNTGIGVVQELRAKRALDRLAILTAGRARVGAGTAPSPRYPSDRRWSWTTCSSCGRGDQVPVDGVVLEADGLELDEALLTGEAEPVAKQPGDTRAVRQLRGGRDRPGRGPTGVGGEAYAARLQAQARRFSLIRSELQQGTNQILRLVTWVMIPAGLLLIVSEFFRSHAACSRRRSAARRPGGGDGARGPGAADLAGVHGGRAAAGPPPGAGPGTGGDRGPGPGRRAVHRQDRDAHQSRACACRRPRRSTAGRRARIAEAIGALAAADEAPNATMPAARRPLRRPARVDGAGSGCRSRRPRKWSGATFAGHGTWLLGAPRVVAAPRLPRSGRGDPADHEAAASACCCSPARPRRWTGTSRPPTRSRPRCSCWPRSSAPDAAGRALPAGAGGHDQGAVRRRAAGGGGDRRAGRDTRVAARRATRPG